jgi:hypothetical protein
MLAHTQRVGALKQYIQWNLSAKSTVKRKRRDPPPILFLNVRTASGQFVCKGALTVDEAVAACIARFPSILQPEVIWQDIICATDSGSVTVIQQYRAEVMPHADEAIVADIVHRAAWYCGTISDGSRAVLVASGGSVARACHSTWFLKRKDGSNFEGLKDVRTRVEAAAIVLHACRSSNASWEDLVQCQEGLYHVDGCTIPPFRYNGSVERCILTRPLCDEPFVPYHCLCVCSMQ